MATIRRSLFAGEVLYRQGDPADCAWLIESGQVALASSDGQRRHDHGMFGPGEMLDELSMLDHGARTAIATAASDAVLLAIEDEAWVAAGVFVFPGVTVGRGSVVGARSILRASTEPYGIYAGAPAIKVGDRRPEQARPPSGR